MDEKSLSSMIDDFIRSKREAKPDKWPSHEAWLDDAANNARHINLVTHAPKFTHGDSKSSGVLFEPEVEHHHKVGTGAIHNPVPDMTGNSAYMATAALLFLTAGEVTLLECLRRGNYAPLEPFARTSVQPAQWGERLLQVLETGTADSHQLAKQVYFPVNEGQYHLLGPLFASSLGQALQARIRFSRFSEQAKNSRAARRAKQADSHDIVEFHGLAEQHFGGTKPQNVSLLNSHRRGHIWLLSTRPPDWRFRQRPPLSERQFWSRFDWQVREPLAQLIQFLAWVQGRASTLAVRVEREARVTKLIDGFIDLAAHIRALPAGWSNETEFSGPWQYWLDPGRRENTPEPGWTDCISRDFGRWLNQSLTNDTVFFGDIEMKVWQKQVDRVQRQLSQDLEVWG